jgi:hypothetical protein
MFGRNLAVPSVLSPTTTPHSSPPRAWATWCGCINNANSDAPHKSYSSKAFLSPHYLTWTASSGVFAGPFLTLQDWQSWFCQCLTEVATSIADLHSLVAEPRGAKEIKCQQWPSRLQRKCQKSVLQYFIGHRLSRREIGFNSLNFE